MVAEMVVYVANEDPENGTPTMTVVTAILLSPTTFSPRNPVSGFEPVRAAALRPASDPRL
ncbi:hypothetical protein GCM10009537_05080 [Corynebacterium riegelii]